MLPLFSFLCFRTKFCNKSFLSVKGFLQSFVLDFFFEFALTFA